MDERDHLRSFQICCKSKLGSVKHKLITADNLCHTLVEENDSLSHELGTLRRRFTDTQKCIKTFSKEKEEIHADLRELKTLLAETEESNEREKDKLNQEKAILSVSLSRMEHEVGRLKSEKNDAANNLNMMEDALQNKVMECESLKRQKDELKQALERKEQELAREAELLKRERDDMKKGFEATMKDNMDLKMELDKARIQFASTENMNKTISDNKEKLKYEFQRVCATFDQMKKEYDMYKKEVQQKVMTLEAEIAKKAVEVVEIQMDRKRAESMVESMKLTITAKDEERNRHTQEVEIVQTEMQREMATKESFIEKLNAQVKGKEKMLKQSDTLLSAKEKTIETMKREVDDHKQQIGSLMKGKEDLMERIKRRDAMINEWTTKCANYEKERQELEKSYSAKFNDLMREFETIKEECRKYVAENKAMQEENRRLRAEIDSLQGNLTNLTNNAQAMKTDIKEMKENKRKFEVECQLLKDQNKNLQNKNEELEREKSKLIHKNKEIEGAKEEVILKLEALKNDHFQLNKVAADRDQELERLRSDLNLKQREKEAKEVEIVEIKSQMATELENCRKEILDHQEEVQLVQARASRERLERETEIVTLKRQMTAREQEVDSLNSKVSTLELDLEKEREIKPQVEMIQQSSASNLFSAVDGECPPTPTADAVKEVELGDEHKDIIEKLQTRWSDVLEERKEIKKAMLNFYRLIDILMDAKDKLEEEMKKQKKKFEKKLKNMRKDAGKSDIELNETAEVDPLNMAAPSDDPEYMEANLNNIIGETSLYDGHIQYLKHQIGLHYSKAETALDRHKSTMKNVTKMANGKSLLPNARTSRSDLSASVSSIDSDYVDIMAQSGYKALADKHFQMINELSALRKEVSELKGEQARLMNGSHHLGSSVDMLDGYSSPRHSPGGLTSPRSVSVGSNLAPRSLNSSFNGRSISVGVNLAPGPYTDGYPQPASAPMSPRRAGTHLNPLNNDCRYQSANEVLRRELDY